MTRRNEVGGGRRGIGVVSLCYLGVRDYVLIGCALVLAAWFINRIVLTNKFRGTAKSLNSAGATVEKENIIAMSTPNFQVEE